MKSGQGGPFRQYYDPSFAANPIDTFIGQEVAGKEYLGDGGYVCVYNDYDAPNNYEEIM